MDLDYKLIILSLLLFLIYFIKVPNKKILENFESIGLQNKLNDLLKDTNFKKKYNKITVLYISI